MPEQEWNPALFLLIHYPEANSSIVTILARQHGREVGVKLEAGVLSLNVMITLDWTHPHYRIGTFLCVI